MYIKRFQVSNYKSYINSEEIEFSPGINVIVGQNNSGKTALLEALSLKLTGEPHQSIRALPNAFSRVDETSKAQVLLTIEKEELRFLLEQIPPPLTILEPSQDGWIDDAEDTIKFISGFQSWIKKSEPKPVELNVFLASSTQLGVEGINCNTDYLGTALNIEDSYSLIKISTDSKGNFLNHITYREVESPYGSDWEPEAVSYESLQGSISETLAYKIFCLFKNRIYRFYAERLNLGSCSRGNSSELKPDASNLAEVIHILPNKNPSLSQKFNQYVSTIFPHIGSVSAIANDDSTVEIRVWSSEKSHHNREDLSIPLSACGTGISQVLSILYVILTSQFPRTIIIDEPQSFLHPGAARKLMEILREFSQHQYFIATHSPMIIAAANPLRVIKLTYEDYQTRITVINSDQTSEQRSILGELGVRLSDVYGADNVLWVEGITEERCFPLILEKVAKFPLRGNIILSIKNTGDLEGKRAHVIFDIYDKLSGAKSLLPPSIGLILDSEGKSEQQKRDLERRSKTSGDGSQRSLKVKFLPRRMYENYLINSEAIAAVINEADKNLETSITSTQVQIWIEQKGYGEDYLKRAGKNESIEQQWLENVDGAKLLKDLFTDLSEARVEFVKTKHSYKLTEWLIEHNPDCLRELADFVCGILGSEFQT